MCVCKLSYFQFLLPQASLLVAGALRATWQMVLICKELSVTRHLRADNASQESFSHLWAIGSRRLWSKILKARNRPRDMLPACVLSCVCLFATPWTVARQAPLSTGILPVRIPDRVALSFPRGSSQPRN